MRTIIVSGRIGSDAQVLTSNTTQRPYVSFSLASNEYKDAVDDTGQPMTYWFRVFAHDDFTIRIASTLTKGKPVNVIGDYTDKIFRRNDGTVSIDRSIMAKSIYYVEGGSRNDQQQGQRVAAPQAGYAQPPQATHARYQAPQAGVSYPQQPQAQGYAPNPNMTPNPVPMPQPRYVGAPQPQMPPQAPRQPQPQMPPQTPPQAPAQPKQPPMPPKQQQQYAQPQYPPQPINIPPQQQAQADDPFGGVTDDLPF